MQYRSVTSLAIMALATTAAAQQARVFTRASQSIKEFGIFGRQADGYQPEDEVCAGEGSTCAEACGAGYEQCSSSDDSVHCFNPADGESCCASGDGSSCLASFYCSRSPDVETFCCPAGSSLEECAKEFGVAAGLVSDLPSYPAASSSAPAPESSSSEVAASSSEIVESAISSSAIVYPSAVPSSGFTSAIANTTAYEPSYTRPAPTTTRQTDAAATSDVSDGAGGDDQGESAATTHGPAAIALVAAVAMLATFF